MNESLLTISQNKQLCTGVPLQYNEPELDPQCPAQIDFNALVSKYYTLFREEIRQDVAFLRRIEDHRDVQAFDNAVYNLRTAVQHIDNSKAAVFYDQWTHSQDWQIAAESLASNLTLALTHLANVSSRVRKVAQLSKEWRELTSIDPESIFESVSNDLNVKFTDNNKNRMIRNIRTRLQKAPSGSNIRVLTVHYCIEEITSRRHTLPVPYHEILDRIGVIGTRRASAVLLIAFSVVETTRLTGEEFLRRVEETWKIATS